MPDISMCAGDGCEKSLDCYRFRAIPTEHRQSYFARPPLDWETGECQYFSPVRTGDRIREIEEIK